MPPQTVSVYETEAIINQYLLFHYGSKAEQLPYAFGPHDAVDFPARCVAQALNGLKLASYHRALDIGCAVGRASFELTRHFAHVVAIDSSAHFIAVAQRLQRGEKIAYKAMQEGDTYAECQAATPVGVKADRVDFRHADALSFFKENETFDFVLAANLICRLADPRAFLETVHLLVNKGGALALISPYSWLEEFTPRAKWLGQAHNSSFDDIQEILTRHFSLMRTGDTPFLLREHARKYQWGVAQLSLWLKR